MIRLTGISNMTRIVAATLSAALISLSACSPEDRSAEMPLPPTVNNGDFEVIADSCLLRGMVVASPNSSLKGCGFKYGNDTLSVEVKCDSISINFEAFTRRLYPGIYYAVAYAENGMGKAFAADSVRFSIGQ